MEPRGTLQVSSFMRFDRTPLLVRRESIAAKAASPLYIGAESPNAGISQPAHEATPPVKDREALQGSGSGIWGGILLRRLGSLGSLGNFKLTVIALPMAVTRNRLSAI